LPGTDVVLPCTCNGAPYEYTITRARARARVCVCTRRHTRSYTHILCFCFFLFFNVYCIQRARRHALSYVYCMYARVQCPQRPSVARKRVSSSRSGFSSSSLFFIHSCRVDFSIVVFLRDPVPHTIVSENTCRRVGRGRRRVSRRRTIRTCRVYVFVSSVVTVSERISTGPGKRKPTPFGSRSRTHGFEGRVRTTNIGGRIYTTPFSKRLVFSKCTGRSAPTRVPRITRSTTCNESRVWTCSIGCKTSDVRRHRGFPVYADEKNATGEERRDSVKPCGPNDLT